jgi:hypothetical protein
LRIVERLRQRNETTVGELLARIADACDESGFEACRNKFYPELGRSRTYELRAIATGAKSVEQNREETRKRVAKHRALRRASVTSPVTESTGSSVTDAGSSVEQRKAFYAAADAVEAFFAEASGAEIYARIPAGQAKRDAVIRAFLDALGVDGMLAAMSPEFGRALRERVPPSVIALAIDAAVGVRATHKKSSAKGKRKTLLLEQAGVDADGNRVFAQHSRR